MNQAQHQKIHESGRVHFPVCTFTDGKRCHNPGNLIYFHYLTGLQNVFNQFFQNQTGITLFKRMSVQFPKHWKPNSCKLSWDILTFKGHLKVGCWACSMLCLAQCCQLLKKNHKWGLFILRLASDLWELIKKP